MAIGTTLLGLMLLLPAGKTAVSVDSFSYPPSKADIAQSATYIAQQQDARALEVLERSKNKSAVHALLRARAHRHLGHLEEAALALAQAANDTTLAPLLQIEQGLLASLQQDANQTIALLLPYIQHGHHMHDAALSPAWHALVDAMQHRQPAMLLQYFQVLQSAIPSDDLDMRSYLLAARAQSEDALGLADSARATRMQQYLEEPVSVLTPTTLPNGLSATSQQLLARMEKLVNGHRNERALADANYIDEHALNSASICKKHFLQGLAARKMRNYAVAEEHLTWVCNQCSNADLVRRASFLNIKVISIRDGLRAIPMIEAFVRHYQDHSMVDDVLFWAGDLYQRRNKDAEATAYYQRILQMPERDDKYAEAAFRIAFIAYKRQDFALAQTTLEDFLHAKQNNINQQETARAIYWLARVYELQNNTVQAIASYKQLCRAYPLSFYAQQAQPRLQHLHVPITMPVAAAHSSLRLCPDWLLKDSNFTKATAYLKKGLVSDAAAFLQAVHIPVGISSQALNTCGPSQALLLLVRLLDQAGAQKEAYTRLRAAFGEEFNRYATRQEMALWRAAYPLAYRTEIAAAEQESKLPTFLLQSIAREESAFDPRVVSWAEAYGLTQLLYVSAKRISHALPPDIILNRPEDLLEATVNARLGGALLGSLLSRFKGALPPAVAAYNAGEDSAAVWWGKQREPDDIAAFVEDITIQETRGYVKRVLRTYGVYNWLYGNTN